MSLLVFLRYDVAPANGVLVPTRGPNTKSRNDDSWPYSIHILWQYISNHSKLSGWKYLYKPTISIMHVLFVEESWKRLIRQNYWVHFSADKKWAIYIRTKLECQAEKVLIIWRQNKNLRIKSHLTVKQIKLDESQLNAKLILYSFLVTWEWKLSQLSTDAHTWHLDILQQEQPLS